MSRLFKQIQKTQPKSQVFAEPLKTSVKTCPKFNLLPFFCIISLFTGIVTAYVYTNRNFSDSAAENANSVFLPIKEKVPTNPAKVSSIISSSIIDAEAPIQEKPVKNISLSEETVAFTEDNLDTEDDEIIVQPIQWDLAPLKNWLHECGKKLLPKLQAFKEQLDTLAYFDITHPIPEKEISDAEKERLDLIQRFLKKFKIDAVRIDGSYSRVMANGQAYYVNTVVSQHPRLKLSNITSQEMIFEDEYNQEYKKKISSND